MSRSTDDAEAGAVAVRGRLAGFVPTVGVVLGSGLGVAAAGVVVRARVGFDELPGFPPPTVQGHAGALLLGEWAGVPAAVFLGRVHGYEGHPRHTLALPVRLLDALGTTTVVLTNASGGVNPAYGPGRLVAIDRQLDLTTAELWTAVARRKDDDPYHSAGVEAVRAAGAAVGLDVPAGWYAGVRGPNYETPAEVRALRHLGADLVGMSTVVEAAAARQRGMAVVGVSFVANHAAGVTDEPINHADVIAAGRAAGEDLGRLLSHLLPRLR